MMAVLYWDPSHSGGTSLGGTGNWDTTSANWWNGTSDVTWNNSNGDTAVFSGTAGTATLSSGIQAGEVDFTTTGYTLTSGSLAISGSGVVDVNYGLTDTISSTLNGSNGLTLTDYGTLVLSGSNFYTGTTAINSGTLQLDSSGAIEGASVTGGAALDLNGQSVDSSVSLSSFSGTLTNSSSSAATCAAYGGNLTVEGTGDITLSGIFEWGTLTKEGSNTVILNGTNCSDIHLEAGTLELGDSGALVTGAAIYGYSGVGTLDLNGQTLTSVSLAEFSGTLTSNVGSGGYSGDIGGQISYSGTGVTLDVDIESGASLQLAGTCDAGSAISGSGTLDLDGRLPDPTAVSIDDFSGTLTNSSSTTVYFGETLDGDITVTGNLVIENVVFDSGEIRIGSGAMVDDGALLSGDGTLDLGGHGASDVSLSGDFVLINSGSTTNTVGGFANGGSLEIGNGVVFDGIVSEDVTLDGGTLDGTVTGNVTLDGGTMVPNLGDSGAVTGDGTVDLDGQDIGSGVWLDDFGGTLTNSSSTTAIFGGTISGDIAFTGSVLIGDAVFDSATLELGATVSVESGANLSGNGTLELNGQNVTSTNFDGDFILRNSSSTAVTVSGAAYGGSLEIDSRVTFDGCVTEDVTLNGALAFNDYESDYSSSSPRVTISGGGTLDLNGQTTASSILLDDFSGTLTNSNSTAATFDGTINASNQASFTVAGTGDIALSGDITGSSTTLTIDGSNTVTLSGSNSLNSVTLVSGTLQLGSSTALSDYTTVSGGGTLDLDGQSLDSTIMLDDFSGTLTNSSYSSVNFAGTINADSSDSFTVAGSGNISLSGDVSTTTLTVDGGNTVSLGGTNSIDNIDLESGTLQLAGSGALSEGASVSTYLGDGTLDLDGQSLDSTISLDNFSGMLTNSSSTAASFAGTINADNQGSFAVSGSGDVTLSGDITGSYGTTLTVNGSNTVSLSGSNSIENVDLESGALQLVSASALSADATIVGYSGNGTLDLDGQSLGSSVSLQYSSAR